MPFVRPLVKLAATADSADEIQDARRPGDRRRHGAARRPGVPGLPAGSCVLAGRRAGGKPGPALDAWEAAGADQAEVAARRDAAARRRAPRDHGRHRPLLGPRRGGAAGAGRSSCRSPCSSTAWPVAACPPTTNCASPARGATALNGADVALVIGVPLDFRLGFGAAFGAGRRDRRDRHRRAGARPSARRSPPSSTVRCPARSATLERRVRRRTWPPERGAWLDALREAEQARRGEEREGLERSAASPLHPMRVYAELAPLLDRDAIVDRRRRRLRLVRRTADRLLRARLLA